jgi:hypothetical protein
MAWFRYIKYGEVTSSSVSSSNYQYPNLRRVIDFPAPSQDIEANTWVFVDISNLGIDKFINTSLSEESQERSYIVVYESRSNNDYTFQPVNTNIYQNRLFFQTAEKHYKDTEIDKQYSLYYKTKNIKNLSKVDNGDIEEYQSVDEINSEFIFFSVAYDDYYNEVQTTDIKKYSLSFLNNNIDWKDYVSQKSGAIAVGSFTGPSLKIYCSKGPEYGIMKLRIIGLSSEATPTSEVVVDWQEIDLYDSEYSDNNEVYTNTGLSYRNYVFEIKSDFEKNILSSDGKIKINKYSYLLDQDLTLGKEELSPFLFTRVVTVIG